jgi:hypothetical protein
MKNFLCLAALALSATEVAAFPSRMFDVSMNEEEKRAIAGIAAKIESEAKQRRQLPGVTPTFDASLQYVSTTGKHAYVAPTSNDLRGPCPGLNAMANHGYIPHNGVATITQFIQGTYDGAHPFPLQKYARSDNVNSLWNGNRPRHFPCGLRSCFRW